MIYICEYDDMSAPALLQQYAEYLPIPAYEGPLEGIKWRKHRERILAWLLFQYVTGREKMKALDIQRTQSGKPYSAADADFYFNISHCENACACIIGDVPCGVDIEKKFEVRENLVRKISHPDEYDVWRTFSPEEQKRQMRFLWSMKESFVKMDGKGLGYGMDSVNLAALLPVKSDGTGDLDGVSYTVRESAAYTLAGCVNKQTDTMPVYIFSETELMRCVLEKNNSI